MCSAGAPQARQGRPSPWVRAQVAHRQRRRRSLDQGLARRGVAERRAGEDRLLREGRGELVEARHLDPTLLAQSHGRAPRGRRAPRRAEPGRRAARPSRGSVALGAVDPAHQGDVALGEVLGPSTTRSGTPRSSQWAYFSPGRIPSRRSTRRRTRLGQLALQPGAGLGDQARTLLVVAADDGHHHHLDRRDPGRQHQARSSPWAMIRPPMIRVESPHEVWWGCCRVLFRSLKLIP